MYGPNFTFLGVPACDLDKPETYKGADVIIVGAPIDSGTSHRSGAKFGPQAIRMGDYLPHDGERPHLALRIDGLKALKVFDAGDLLMPPGDLTESLRVLRAATEKISRAGAIAVVLGGDHSIASADVAGIADHRGLNKVLDESFARLTDGCEGVFLSVDIDVVDPGMAPGTGTPEPGGMTSRELLESVRRICLELPVVGIDVVEVSPPFDSADITAILANRVVLEAVSAIAKRRSGESYSPTKNLLDR